jgi:ADP-ribose pyrophosphatase YjhB (NUDIX family)
MSYLSDLRKIVGHIPLIAVGATVIVLNQNNEILLNLRSDTKTWGIPGGAAEIGERIEETASRELFEETGLKAEQLELLTVLSGNDYYFVYPNGDMLHSVIVLYLAKSVSGQLLIMDDESSELKFFNFDNLPALESRAAKIVDWYHLNHQTRASIEQNS